jgi:hypothetical protein
VRSVTAISTPFGSERTTVARSINGMPCTRAAIARVGKSQTFASGSIAARARMSLRGTTIAPLTSIFSARSCGAVTSA